jgi:hypothetical protein
MALRTLRVGSIVQVVALVVFVTAAPLRGQELGSGDVQRRVAELKQSVAANQAKLRHYQWLQTTEVSVKGETKKEQQQQVRYGPDGKLVKTPVGEPEQPQQQARGLKGKVVAKKVEEMKDYIERTKTLISHYIPPEPEKMQASLQAGKASFNPGAGVTTIIFTDYYKPGDKVTFGFDTTAKKVRSYDISTFLDDPVKDVVTVTNRFAALPDGTNYLQQTILNMPAKQIQITTTNSGHSKVD